MTAADLADQIIAALVRKRGGTQRRWRTALGAIKVHDPVTHPHCNWSAAPNGSAAEVATIEDLMDEVRLRHPIIERG